MVIITITIFIIIISIKNDTKVKTRSAMDMKWTRLINHKYFFSLRGVCEAVKVEDRAFKKKANDQG